MFSFELFVCLIEQFRIKLMNLAQTTINNRLRDFARHGHKVSRVAQKSGKTWLQLEQILDILPKHC